MAATHEKLRVAILGCSGSIGSQALDVCRKHSDKLDVVALSVYSSCDILVKAAREFNVSYVAVANSQLANHPVFQELPPTCRCTFGPQAVYELAALDEVDCVLNALVGFAGIDAAYTALTAKKRLAYANKESIVCGGELLMPLADTNQIIPVDSEHSAIFQSLVGEKNNTIKHLWLTCSGGPFFSKTQSELLKVTANDALAHPTWDMGAKITIDSASLMNKGLEVIEAMHLFGVAIDDIEVLIHKESRIHSMVEYVDGSVKAQLGPTDMRIPIQYAFSFPTRWEAPCEVLDWHFEAPLSFAQPDEHVFRCLWLAKQAGKEGGILPTAMNAANEIANEAFRLGECSFLDIATIVESVMDATDNCKLESIEQLHECDSIARKKAQLVLEGLL